MDPARAVRRYPPDIRCSNAPDIHAAAERDGKVGEVAAYAASLAQRVGGTFFRTGVLVSELHVRMDEIANRLHAAPAARSLAEQFPGFLHQPISFAIAAGEQVHQAVVRQIGDRMFFSRRDRRDLEGRCPRRLRPMMTRSSIPPAPAGAYTCYRSRRCRLWSCARGSREAESSVIKSAARDGCTLTMKIMGVGSGHSNAISKPT